MYNYVLILKDCGISCFIAPMYLKILIGYRFIFGGNEEWSLKNHIYTTPYE